MNSLEASALKRQVLGLSARGGVRVFTDPLASPTGFPIKMVCLPGTRGDPATPARAQRLCDLGYLRQAYRRPDATIGWRCPAEPVEDYVAKGGTEEQTLGRQCLCNGLMANIGLGRVGGANADEAELPLITSGDDVARFLKPGATTYTAADVVDDLLAGMAATRS